MLTFQVIGDDWGFLGNQGKEPSRDRGAFVVSQVWEYLSDHIIDELYQFLIIGFGWELGVGV